MYFRMNSLPIPLCVLNVKVRATTACRPLSHLVTDRHLRLFGHFACSSPQDDHHRHCCDDPETYLPTGIDR